jgi:TonB family protein
MPALGTKSMLRLSLVAALTLAICGPQLHAQSSALVEEKRPIKRLVQPLVPALARKLNLTGTVKIEVTVSPDGTVKRTRVIGGHPLLASEAESAAQKSTFQPGPRETAEVIEFKFSSIN